ncbi:MAG: hypothetical protein VX699_09800 [Myxococcota bacterium]|nr:hypothetical protein [Myxococcota bacterium]
MNRKLLLSFAVVLAGYGVFWVIHAGFHSPPGTLRGGDLGPIVSVTPCRGEAPKDFSNTLARWKIQGFYHVSEDGFPQGPVDCTFHIETTTGRYKAFYQAGAPRLYFSFLPRYTHGWFQKPPPGDWPQPLYQAPLTPWLIQTLGLPESPPRALAYPNPRSP